MDSSLVLCGHERVQAHDCMAPVGTVQKVGSISSARSVGFFIDCLDASRFVNNGNYRSFGGGFVLSASSDQESESHVGLYCVSWEGITIAVRLLLVVRSCDGSCLLRERLGTGTAFDATMVGSWYDLQFARTLFRGIETAERARHSLAGFSVRLHLLADLLASCLSKILWKAIVHKITRHTKGRP